MKVYASKDIECGHFLYTCYNSMPIQSQFMYYGFVDVESECYLDIPIYYGTKIIANIIGKDHTNAIRNWIEQSAQENYPFVPLSLKSTYKQRSGKEILKILSTQLLAKLVKIAI
jgi:hypothetical protein